MKIYQVYDSEDMAQSDDFFPTITKAVANVRENYGIIGPIVLDEEGRWECEKEDGYVVYIERNNVIPTKDGICSALKFLPNR